MHDTTATISRLFLLYAKKKPAAAPAIPGIIPSVEYITAGNVIAARTA